MIDHSTRHGASELHERTGKRLDAAATVSSNRPRAVALATGRRGEQLAAEHLTRRGFSIIARNVRTAAGEIDLIADDGTTIAFVEVKTTCVRAGSSRATGPPIPLERLGARQRGRLRKLALSWLRERPPGSPYRAALRFDAIGIVIDSRGRLVALDHVEDAW